MLLTTIAATGTAAKAQDAVSCVQTYLAEAGYRVGAVDGKLGKGTIGQGSYFAQIYPELGLPELSKSTVDAWCTALQTPAAQDVRSARSAAIAPTGAPAETIAKGGGLKFSNPLVAENFAGMENLRHEYEPSFLAGRVSAEVDPARVNHGASSIRMSLLPGDCGRTVDPTGNWNDCEHFNERVDVSTAPSNAGEWYYGLSVMLDTSMLKIRGYQALYNSSEINLYQWFQFDSGACFNLVFAARTRKLGIDVRCSTGELNHRFIKLVLDDSSADVWHELVVHANWSTGDDGFFRVVQNGKMVMNYAGPTIVEKGRPLINDHAQLYAYGGDNEAESARMHYRTPMTVWFDDMLRTQSLDELKAHYSFPDGALTDFASALPILDFDPSLPAPIEVLKTAL